MSDFMMVTMPGNFLADLIPICKVQCVLDFVTILSAVFFDHAVKHFTRHTRTVAVLRKHLDDFLNIPFTFVKKQMVTFLSIDQRYYYSLTRYTY